NKLDEAEEMFQRALQLRRQTQCLVGEAYNLYHLAEIRLRQNKLGEAEELLEHSLQLYKQAAESPSEAIVLEKLTDVRLLRGEALTPASTEPLPPLLIGSP
ncbi:hypothetical protein H0H87_005547, partial [Tephrocybe sp. NHM501043]